MEKLERTKLETLHRFLTESRRVTLVSHTHPDGDAVGSTTALYLWLRSLGKEAHVCFPTRVPDSLAFIAQDAEARAYDPGCCDADILSSDLLVCLDFNALNRAEGMETLLRSLSAKKVLIDHHLAPAEDEFDLCFSRTDVSSACELLFYSLMEMPEIGGDARRLPPASAAALMAGMTTDTNNFAKSVFPSTLEMASRLLAAGVDRDALLEALYNRYRENRIRLFGEMLKDRLVISPRGVACMFLDEAVKRRWDVREGESDGLVNQPLAIDRVKLSVLVKEEDDGSVRVSLRSKRGVSANRCARLYFHGGGHEQAAGGKILVPQDVPAAAAAGDFAARMAEQYMELYES